MHVDSPTRKVETRTLSICSKVLSQHLEDKQTVVDDVLASFRSDSGGFGLLRGPVLVKRGISKVHAIRSAGKRTL